MIRAWSVDVLVAIEVATEVLMGPLSTPGPGSSTGQRLQTLLGASQ